MPELVFLKLGGSLITDKTRPYTPHLARLDDLAAQLAQARKLQPDQAILLGHGSGSFGHTAAREYHTRDGLSSTTDAHRYWDGFSQVWYQASALNRHVMDALQRAGLPAVAFAPVAAVTARNGKVAHWDLAPLQAALRAGLLPVVYGDVVIDETRGGTILSTEDLFEHLAAALNPRRILLAGLEGAVWADFPTRSQRVERITPLTFESIRANLGASHGADVTGGMESKVRQMLDLVARQPGLSAQIFSGEENGSLLKTLHGDHLGTLLSAI